MVYFSFAAFCAHYLGKRANRCFVYISNPKRRGIGFIACSHRADYGCARFFCVHDKCELARYSVDRINNIVVLREVKHIFCLGQIKGFVCFYNAIRIDRTHTLRRNINLVFTDGIQCCNNLTVDVRDADGVAVDQIKRSHTGTRKRFHRITSHTADPEHRNT